MYAGEEFSGSEGQGRGRAFDREVQAKALIKVGVKTPRRWAFPLGRVR